MKKTGRTRRTRWRGRTGRTLPGTGNVVKKGGTGRTERTGHKGGTGGMDRTRRTGRLEGRRGQGI
jgi:hypothetical protein